MNTINTKDRHEQPTRERQKRTHHDDKDPNKNRNKVGEESKRMLDVVHIPMVCPLDDLLGIKHHISQKDEEAKVELQSCRQQSVCLTDRMLSWIWIVNKFLPQT